MENPVTEIAPIITALTTSPPIHQRHVLETYFLPDSSFDHPLYRVHHCQNSFFTSRFLILAIYRCYKVLSPNIQINVNSVAFDEPKGKLYVDSMQVFTFWFTPWHHIVVSLVSVLDLEKRLVVPRQGEQQPEEGEEKWYIARQNDLYQTDQWIAFLPFLFPGARTIVGIVKDLAALACLIGATLAALMGVVGECGVEEMCEQCRHVGRAGRQSRDKRLEDRTQAVILEEDKELAELDD
ncbi:hypothetical protein P167DRAFT_136617 [Morchella conica CCBAS932]|uniref:SigF-like NTF2-like domain-containing protein n=2 Tax=Morchella sect. Distantes TaxID=1051054 RepID=A0A3N4KRS7_9PEZI|nr:hypothetical protein P167DRAFT_136617 [Morchella conica CCBAS932]